MNTPAPIVTRPPRGRGEQDHDERRNILAESALRTLGELGYARTSLREIAAHSPFTHGLVHYYFRDKTALILHGVRLYKARCVHRYDEVMDDAGSADELLQLFADKLAETIEDESEMHRLWYDLRTQSMFEVKLRDDVVAIDAQLGQMIERVLLRYAQLADRELDAPVVGAYPVVDGLFEHALLRHLAGDEYALVDLRRSVADVLPRLLG